MKDIHNHYDFEVTESNAQLYKRIRNFVFRPILVGLFAFSIFFSTILATKVIMYLLSESITFGLNIYDVIFALIGFGIGFLIEFILQIRRVLSK